MTKILSIIFVMIFTKNYVLVQFLGICPFLGVSKKFDSAVGHHHLHPGHRGSRAVR